MKRSRTDTYARGCGYRETTHGSGTIAHREPCGNKIFAQAARFGDKPSKKERPAGRFAGES